MYKPTEPIRCPKCGAIVKVDLYKILTPNPKCYEWTCPNCGEKGNTKHGDVITFENQIGRATSGYIRKVDEPDPGVGVTTTNADDNTRIDATPAIYSTTTECEICGEKFKYDAKHMHICPKCREAVMKMRKNIYDAQHNIGSYGCTVYRNSFNQPKVAVDDTVCGEGSVSVSSRKAIDGDIKLTIQGNEIE